MKLVSQSNKLLNVSSEFCNNITVIQLHLPICLISVKSASSIVVLSIQRGLTVLLEIPEWKRKINRSLQQVTRADNDDVLQIASITDTLGASDLPRFQFDLMQVSNIVVINGRTALSMHFQ